MTAANKDFFEALSMLEHERGITAEYLIEKIKAAIIIAVKKNYEVEEDHIRVDIDPDTGRFDVALIQDIVADEVFSTKTADFAPRLKASIPIPPLPLNRSRKRQSGISGCRILKSVSFIRSVVGRVSIPGTVLRARRLAFPAITLISDLISNPGHHVPVRESEVRLLQCWWQPVCYTDHNA